jgi:hypothetical protein
MIKILKRAVVAVDYLHQQFTPFVATLKHKRGGVLWRERLFYMNSQSALFN